MYFSYLYLLNYIFPYFLGIKLSKDRDSLFCVSSKAALVNLNGWVIWYLPRKYREIPVDDMTFSKIQWLLKFGIVDPLYRIDFRHILELTDQKYHPLIS